MSGKKDIEASKQIASGPVSDSSLNLSKRDMGKEGISSKSVPPVSAVASDVPETKAATDHPMPFEQSVYYPATSCYDYYYPGYNGAFGQSDDNGYTPSVGSYTGVQSDSNSLVYYYPSYTPYQTGTDYLPQLGSFEQDPFPYYNYDSTYSGNGLTRPAAGSGIVKPEVCTGGSGKSNGYQNQPVNSNFQQFSNFSTPFYQNQTRKPVNKFGSNFQTNNLRKGYHPTSKVSLYENRNRDSFMHHTPGNYQANGRTWNSNNYKYNSNETFGRNSGFESLTELTRGPRAETRNSSLGLGGESERAGLGVEREKYNLKDFQTEYKDAKFYVIKSYSEDDVHKCIKYDVWSSTPNGNKKLDSAFREADAKTSKIGVKCPVFLFFSVNSSGQFVGVAEMIGPVDFSKNMDFWQLDKWNGFFPIKWHIIKDVPNTLLRHIILVANENKSVTYSRDTQEIGLEQGLEMLRIFKNHVERTSVLDDFNFYENREKSLKGKRNVKSAASQSNVSRSVDSSKKHLEAGEGVGREQSMKNSRADPSSLVALAKNLSISSKIARE